MLQNVKFQTKYTSMGRRGFSVLIIATFNCNDMLVLNVLDVWGHSHQHVIRIISCLKIHPKHNMGSGPPCVLPQCANYHFCFIDE